MFSIFYDVVSTSILTYSSTTFFFSAKQPLNFTATEYFLYLSILFLSSSHVNIISTTAFSFSTAQTNTRERLKCFVRYKNCSVMVIDLLRARPAPYLLQKRNHTCKNYTTSLLTTVKTISDQVATLELEQERQRLSFCKKRSYLSSHTAKQIGDIRSCNSNLCSRRNGGVFRYLLTLRLLFLRDQTVAQKS